MKKTTRPDAVAAIISARRAAADAAAAQPKRKRKPPRSTKREPVAVIAAPPIERRGMQDLARLGQAIRLEPEVTKRRRELDDIRDLMTGRPRPR